MPTWISTEHTLHSETQQHTDIKRICANVLSHALFGAYFVNHVRNTTLLIWYKALLDFQTVFFFFTVFDRTDSVLVLIHIIDGRSH